jgi:general secretion pathway protein A
MFEQFFGLSENPFNLTPDPKFLFLSKAHEEALSHLKYGIERRKGFVMISGEVGAGKTTICRALLGSLPKTVKTALVLNPALSDIELLQTINQDFGINAAHTSKKALLDELYEFLINVFIRGENAVLIIDECQNLSPDVLEQIRMLSNLETEKEKLLQIVLVGQPELVKLLSSPSMKQINDRIVLRYHIGPLSLADMRSYINHRLIVSGSRGDIVFSSMAFRRIFRYSNGIPRRINALAERAMLICYLRSSRKITEGIVSLAIKELQGNYSVRRLKVGVLAPALSAMAILVLGIVWPTIFNDLSVKIGSWVKAEERQSIQPIRSPAVPLKAQQNPVDNQMIKRDSRDWIIRDYNDALEILSQLPEAIAGPDAMNLHPHPDYLKLVPQPSIVSAEGGYLVLLKVESGFVRVVGENKAVVEIPMDEFKKLYRWNVILSYAKPLHPEMAYSLNTAGDDVAMIQDVLARIGLLSAAPNGVFGIETEQAIEKFQELFGLKRDGIAGPETMMLLRAIHSNDKGMR